MYNKILNGIREVNRIYGRNKGELFHRINQFFIAVSILVVTVIYAVNSDKIEKYNDRNLWPFSITKLANKHLGIRFKLTVGVIDTIKFDDTVPPNLYHFIVVDQTALYKETFSKLDEEQLEILHQEIAKMTQATGVNIKLSGYTLGEKIVLYYLGKHTILFDEDNFGGFDYVGGADGEFCDYYSNYASFYKMLVNKFKKRMVDCETVTNFSEILDEVGNKISVLSNKGNSDDELINRPMISLSIISDFAHETPNDTIKISKCNNRGRVPIKNVEQSLKRLSALDQVHQINLLQLPLIEDTPELRERSTHLIESFRIHFSNSFLFNIDSGTFNSQKNNITNLLRMLDYVMTTIPLNGEIQAIKYYYPYKHELTHSAARGHIILEELHEGAEYFIALASGSIEKRKDFCIHYSTEMKESNFYQEIKLGHKICLGETIKLNEGWFKSLIPNAERKNEVNDAHFVIYPIGNKNIKSKAKVKLEFFEMLPRNDALLLGLFSITFVGALLSYFCVFILSLIKSQRLLVVLAVFLLLEAIILIYLTLTFPSFFLVFKESIRSILLLTIPFAAPFSLFFWFADYSKSP